MTDPLHVENFDDVREFMHEWHANWLEEHQAAEADRLEWCHRNGVSINDDIEYLRLHKSTSICRQIIHMDKWRVHLKARLRAERTKYLRKLCQQLGNQSRVIHEQRQEIDRLRGLLQEKMS
ncbi:hypothetical protein SEA_CULVER_3 [Gordonia phage Culver]|nr:hypothetical protein SEA_CULVER_3 [Gordonia phage Culver]